MWSNPIKKQNKTTNALFFSVLPTLQCELIPLYGKSCKAGHMYATLPLKNRLVILLNTWDVFKSFKFLFVGFLDKRNTTSLLLN